MKESGILRLKYGNQERKRIQKTILCNKEPVVGRKFNMKRNNKFKMKQIIIKIKNFPINISTNILIPLLLFSFIGKQEIFVIALVFSFLHELAHLAAAGILKYKPKGITVNMFGEVLNMENMNIMPEHGILINISGPFFNLAVSFVLLILYREGVIPAFGNIMLINAVLGLFNLLPFYPLDGGKIVFIYLKYFMEENTAKRLIFIFGKVFLFFNFILGIYLVQYNILNSLISLLSVNIYAALRREEQAGWYKSIMKAKKEQESGKYV